MTYSLNEVEATCKKAARGAGLPWGLCEEAGKGTRWLAAFDLPGPEALFAVLQMQDGAPVDAFAPISLEGDWSGSGGILSPLVAGAALSDCAAKLRDGQTVTLHGVSHPLLLLPFAKDAALILGSPVSLQWDGVSLVTDGHQLSLKGACEALAATEAGTVICQAGGELSGKRPFSLRASVPESCWSGLSGLAARTYAPATDASRLLGAGAGLNDND